MDDLVEELSVRGHFGAWASDDDGDEPVALPERSGPYSVGRKRNCLSDIGPLNAKCLAAVCRIGRPDDQLAFAPVGLLCLENGAFRLENTLRLIGQAEGRR